MMAPLIQASGVGVTLGATRALDGVDFAIREREIVTVVGPNGSGKTTLLRLLIGALKPQEGTITRRADLTIGYVPQKLSLDSAMPLTADRFLALGGERDAKTRAAMLDRVGAGGLGGRQLAALSGGQLQRVLLARALLRRPNLVALDEPTQSLDQIGAAAFYQLIEAVRSETGCAVVMVSHDLHVVMSASDRVVCLNGHVCCEGTPTVVSAAPEWRALFGSGTGGTFALYRHDHDHGHYHGPACSHDDAVSAQ
ncbi:MAG: zinc transport system ATP-binding protein [Paracoccaceae bacterium]|jgi:zinc transport system ATP-binding protein